MSPDQIFEQYRKDQQENAKATALAVVALLKLLPSKPTPGQWRQFLQQAFAFVVRGRRVAFDLADRFYNETTPNNVKAPDLREPKYTLRDFEKAMEPARARLIGVGELQAESAADVVAEQVSAITETQAKNGGRDAISQTAATSKNILGYARVPESGHPCGFCVMLASRSGLKLPLYKTARTARFTDGGDLYHDHCDCHPVPVYTFKSWPGKAANDAAAQQWLDAMEAEKKKTGSVPRGTDALNALRRHLYAQQQAS